MADWYSSSEGDSLAREQLRYQILELSEPWGPTGTPPSDLQAAAGRERRTGALADAAADGAVEGADRGLAPLGPYVASKALGGAAVGAGQKAFRAREQRVTELIERIDVERFNVGKEDNETTRLTINVPHHNTRLNLGKPSVDWEMFSPGLSGRSDEHIHFLVTDVGAGKPSLVSLGSPPLGTCVNNQTLKSWDGYSMVTEGVSWQEAKEQHAIVSTEKDVVIQAAGHDKSAVLHATQGSVSVAGAQNVVIASPGGVHIGAQQGESVEKSEHGVDHRSEVTRWVFSSYLETATKGAQVLKSIGEALLTFGRLRTSPQLGRDAWDKQGIVLSAVADIAGLCGDGYSLYSDIDARLNGGSSAGVLTLNGSNGVAVGSGISTAIFSRVTTSIAGGLGASVMGNVIASVHGAVSATIASSFGTTVRSLKSVEVRADTGELLAHGGKKVTIACESGPLLLGGSKAAQLTSGGPLLLRSKTKAYFGAGTGAVIATPISVMVCHIKGGEAEDCNFADAAFEAKRPHFLVGPQSAAVHAEGSEMTLDSAGVRIKTKDLVFELPSGTASVDAKKVMIG